MVCELTVVLKDDSRTYRQKFLSYNPFVCIPEDPYVLQCVEDAKKNFQEIPEDISVKIHMEIQ